MCVKKKNFHVSCTWYKSLEETMMQTHFTLIQKSHHSFRNVAVFLLSLYDTQLKGVCTHWWYLSSITINGFLRVLEYSDCYELPAWPDKVVPGYACLKCSAQLHQQHCEIKFEFYNIHIRGAKILSKVRPPCSLTSNPTTARQECFELLEVSNSPNYSFSIT